MTLYITDALTLLWRALNRETWSLRRGWSRFWSSGSCFFLSVWLLNAWLEGVSTPRSDWLMSWTALRPCAERSHTELCKPRLSLQLLWTTPGEAGYNLSPSKMHIGPGRITHQKTDNPTKTKFKSSQSHLKWISWCYVKVNGTYPIAVAYTASTRGGEGTLSNLHMSVANNAAITGTFPPSIQIYGWQTPTIYPRVQEVGRKIECCSLDFSRMVHIVADQFGQGGFTDFC